MKIYNLQFTIYKKILLISLFIVFCSLFVPLYSYANTAVIKIDTGHSSVNAVEATLNLPLDIVVDKIYTGDSRIVIWIESPNVDSKTRTISFSGITPGGFQGTGPIFTISGNFESKDLSRFTFSKIRALSNDGLGVPVAVKLYLESTKVIKDSISPENFTPVISLSKDFFWGKPFVSFFTADKGVGIDHYEYALTWFFSPSKNDWQRTESPLVLEKTDLSRRIFIKAVDHSGNEKISTVVAIEYYETLGLWVILLVVIVSLGFFFKKIWSRS